MAQVNDTDTFLVNRSDTSYQLQAQNLMAELQDTDLMLVNRSGTSYKATGAEIKESLKPPAEIDQPTIIAPQNGAGAPLMSDPISTVETYTIPGGWNDTGLVKNSTRNFAYGNGVYITTSGTNNDSSIKYSYDCVTWLDSNMPNTGINSNGPAWAVDKFILTNSQNVYASTDGVTWDIISTIPTFNTQSGNINSANGKIYVRGNKVTYVSSDRGLTWKECTGLGNINTPVVLNGMVYRNDIYVLNGGNTTGGSPGVYWSDDGIAWNQSTGWPSASSNAEGMNYFKGNFYMPLTNNGVYTSSTGKTWTKVDGSPAKAVSLTEGNGILYAASTNSINGGNTRTATSTNGTTWDYIDDPYSPTSNMGSCLFLGNRFLWAGQVSLAAVGLAWSYTGSDATLPATKLTLSGTTGFGQFDDGVSVVQDDLDPTTETNIFSKDEASSSFIVADTGNWNGGNVNRVVGPGYLSLPAIDPTLLTFIGSTPTGTEITDWGDATWEVSTDIAFTSPMVATKSISPSVYQTLDPLERGAIILEDKVNYYARLKYDGNSSATVSPYSNVINFVTAEGSANNTTTPGDVYFFQRAPQFSGWLNLPGDEKVVIAAGGETANVCVTTSGTAYEVQASDPNNPTITNKGTIPVDVLNRTICVGLGQQIFYPTLTGQLNQLNELIYDAVYELPSGKEVDMYSFSQAGAYMMIRDTVGDWYASGLSYSNTVKYPHAVNNVNEYKNILHGNYSDTACGYGVDNEIYDITYSTNSSSAGFTITSEVKNAEWSGVKFKQVICIDRVANGNPLKYGIVGLTENDELKIIRPVQDQINKAIETSPTLPSNIKKMVSSGTQIALTTTDNRLFLGGYLPSNNSMRAPEFFVDPTVVPTSSGFGEMKIPRPCDRLTVSQYSGISVILP